MRKYVTAHERFEFTRAACREGGEIATFCLTLAITGARISEVLALTPARLDRANCAIVFETLKRRRRAVFRAIPVPLELLRLLERAKGAPGLFYAPPNLNTRLWGWGRTSAWKYVRHVMLSAGIAEGVCKPKALRHGFAVDAGQNGVQLNIVQRWLGHARIETTAIYASALGKEERALARRTWKSLELDRVIGQYTNKESINESALRNDLAGHPANATVSDR